ncbi:MAG: anti-sigma factor family protein [Acidimicrobiales bacterium]
MVERLTACPEWRDDLAGLLMAQIAPDREAALRAHLAICEVCRSETDSLLVVSAVALAADPDPTVDGNEDPPAELGDRIVASIAAERRTRRLVRGGLVALAAAAAATVAIVVLPGDSNQPPLQGEEIAFTLVPAGASVEAVIADEGEGSLVALVATGLDPDVTYALWLSPPDGTWDDRVAAGAFRPDDRGDVDVRLRCALPADDAGRVWATTPEGDVALDTE